MPTDIVHGQRDAVDRVGGDPPEDAPRLVDRIVDDGEARRGENERCGAARRIGGPRHGGAAIRLLQRRRIVDAVAGHRNQVAARLQRLDDGVFVLRKHTGKTIRPLDGVGDCRRDVVGPMSLGKASAAGMMCVPMPSRRAGSIAVAVSSPGTILMRTPFSFAIAIVALESSRGGSNIGNMPSSDQLCPASSERATASAREPLAASSSTVVLTRCATSAGGLASSTMTCGAPLLTILPWGSVTVAAVRLLTGSKGTNFICL